MKFDGSWRIVKGGKDGLQRRVVRCCGNKLLVGGLVGLNQYCLEMFFERPPPPVNSTPRADIHINKRGLGVLGSKQTFCERVLQYYSPGSDSQRWRADSVPPNDVPIMQSVWLQRVGQYMEKSTHC